MYAIISPAKKLDFETPAPVDVSSEVSFGERSYTLIKKLRSLSAAEVSQLMNLSQKLTQLNVDRYNHYKKQAPEATAKQALFAFSGDTYKGLEAYQLKKSDVQYAQKHLGILSGLYGLVKPLDLIQPYRLEMGTKLKVGNSKDLYEYWAKDVTSLLNQYLKKEKYLINLSSQEYFSVVDQKQLKGTVIHPVFKEKKGEQLKVIGIHSKKARGMMAKFMIQNRLKKPEELKEFNSEGYRFNPQLSSEHEYVYIR
jgi:cytoplasmic iron level regulating protein YaaA (DUF328/UPF0246 family)